jgi:hypothetical protein
MLPKQGTLTVVIPLSSDVKLDGLSRLFAEVQANVWANGARSGPIPFGQMPTVHFARFAISEADVGSDATPFPPCLLFSTEYDGDLDAHIDELIKHAGPALLFVLGCCDGFESEAGSAELRVRRFLKARSSRPGAFYIGALGRTVEQILRERELCDSMRGYASQLPPDTDPIDAWKGIAAHARPLVRPTGVEVLSLTAHQRGRALAFWGSVLGGALVALYLIAAFPLAIALLVFAAFWLRLEEEIEADRVKALEAAESQAQNSEQESRREARHAEFEDRWDQNQLSAITVIAPSALRRILQRLVLAAVGFRVRFRFTRGLLDGVPTIHFAHWHVIEKGRRLLFVSNYDGSWASYLEDFIVHAAGPISAIWSHSVGFPPTRFLMWGGAEDGPRFKAFARRHQVVPCAWYSAYPDLSVEEINRNSQLVAGLKDARLGQARYRLETKKWLETI